MLWALRGPNERAGSNAPALCVPKWAGNADDRRLGRAAPALKGLMTELKSINKKISYFVWPKGALSLLNAYEANQVSYVIASPKA